MDSTNSQFNPPNDHFNRLGQNQNGSHKPDVPEYQNILELQPKSNPHYQVPKCSQAAQLKRTQFSQHASRSFPIQSNQSKVTNNACLRKGFQPNSALNKINKVTSHPLAQTDELTNSFTLNRTTSAQSKSVLQPRYWRTQSTTSAISLASVVSGSFVSNTSIGQPANNAIVGSKFNPNKSSSIYSNTPPLPIAASGSTLTKSGKRNTRTSLNYSMASFKSNYLAPFSSPEIELNGVESVTSSSYLHGFILIAIILLSITAFVLSKLQDACEDFFFSNHSTCYPTAQWFFSSMLLVTSLFAFIVYFLHLIGQCDYLNLMAKRKVFSEILVTCLVIFCLLLSSLTLILSTVAIFNWINTVSLIIAFVVCVLYKVRIYLLFREYRMLNDKPVDVCMEIGDHFGQPYAQTNETPETAGHQLNHQLNQQLSHQFTSLPNAQLNQQISRRFSCQSGQQSKDCDDDDEVFT